LHTIAIVALTILAAPVGAVELQDIIRQSIRDGKAGGELTGRISDAIAARTGSTLLPQALVETIGSFVDPGCKRVRVLIRQGGVRSKDGKLVIVAFPSFELNMCLDGSPPKETLGVEAVKLRQEDLRRQMEELQAGRGVNSPR